MGARGAAASFSGLLHLPLPLLSPLLPPSSSVHRVLVILVSEPAAHYVAYFLRGTRIYIYMYIYATLFLSLQRLSPFRGPPPPISILGLMHEECRVPRNNIFRVFRDPCNIRNIFMNIWADHTVRAGHSVRAPICFMKFERGKRVAVRKVSLSRTREGREEGWHRGGWTISLYWRHRKCRDRVMSATRKRNIIRCEIRARDRRLNGRGMGEDRG